MPRELLLTGEEGSVDLRVVIAPGVHILLLPVTLIEKLASASISRFELDDDGRVAELLRALVAVKPFVLGKKWLQWLSDSFPFLHRCSTWPAVIPGFRHPIECVKSSPLFDRRSTLFFDEYAGEID